jgi:hypothetical protein
MGYTEGFEASAQYNDWKGTVAADDSDHETIKGYLRQHELMSDDEFLLSVSFYSGEGSTSIRVFLYKGGPSIKNVGNEIAAIKYPVPVREVRLDRTTDEFLKLFKRFNVTFQRDGINIKGRDFETQDQ